MDYNDIVVLALSYSDREDTEVSDRMDNFISMVESKINRVLRVSKMSMRATLNMVNVGSSQEYLSLPSDFGGIRDIELRNGTTRCTLKYLSPEQMNQLITSQNTTASIYYTITAQQFQIYPTQDDGFLEIVYYQKLIPLSLTDTNNWMSTYNPDGYVFGLLVEISSFAKDADAAALWKARFDEVLAEIETEDSTDRWSGTSLEVRVG